MVSSRLIAFCAIAVASMAAGCSSAEPKPVVKKVAPSVNPSTSGASTPTDQARTDALSAYTGMWADYEDAARTADYKDQQLTRHATNAALGAMVQSLYALQRQGLVIRGTLITNPTIADMVPADAPTQIDVKDCASDVNWLQYVAATGKPKDGAHGGHRIVTARVTKQYNLWRVANYQVQPEGTC